jgi:hypothetical protein
MIRGFIAWVHAAVCALTTEDGRKGWAMLAALGCSVVMSAYAAAVLWIVKGSPMLAFWLGIAALGIILIVITGLMVLLGVRRSTTLHAKSVSLNITDEGGGNAS